MTTVNYSTYSRDLMEFSQKHNKKSELKIYTSPLENNRYHKEYCWEDGANFFEITERVEETVEIEVHGIKMEVKVPMYRTEYWSTEFGSKYFYQRA